MISDAMSVGRYPPTVPYVCQRPAKCPSISLPALGDPAILSYGGATRSRRRPSPLMLSSAAWAAMFDDPDLDLSLSRLGRADQRFSRRRPLRVGDAVSRDLGIDKVRARGSSAFITITVALDADGRTRSAMPRLHPAAHLARSGGGMSAEAGTQAAGVQHGVTRAALVRYAGASTDFDPIRLSDPEAHELGLPTVSPTACSPWAPHCGWSPTGGRPAPGASDGRTVHQAGHVEDTDEGSEVGSAARCAEVADGVATVAASRRFFNDTKVLGARDGGGAG